LFALIAFMAVAQQREGDRISFSSVKSHSLTIQLDSTDTDIIYIPFPLESWPRWTSLIGESLPTYVSTHAEQNWLCSGDVFISIIPTFAGTEESDSLSGYIRPLMYDANKQAWSVASVDLTYLVFDTPNLYAQNAVDWLNWTSGSTYTCTLSNELWPTAGFALYLDQRANAQPTFVTTLSITLWFVR